MFGGILTERNAPLELIAAIADDLPFGIWVASVPEGDFVWSNRTFAEIMGMGPRDDVAVGEYAKPYGIHDLEGNLYPEEKMPFVRALKARAPVVVEDIVIHRPDGGRANIRALARPMRRSDGEVGWIVITFTDITREVSAEMASAQSEARLRRAQRMEAIASLTGGVVHDFNNLLASIKMLTGALRKNIDDDLKREQLDRIEYATQSAMDLTASLLGFARRGPRQPALVSLNAIALAVSELLKQTVDKRIRLEVALDARPGEVIGDPARLEQLLLNLALNARDAMPSGGAMSIRTSQEADAVVLEVSDSGPGIPAELREKIFEPWFSTKQESATSGTGLGLSVVREVAKEMSGRVEVLDGTPSGTRMRVTLPAARSGR
jgi:signal transduction histidine kinase